MNKSSIEILRNIELLWFLEKRNLDKFKKIIIEKLSDIPKLETFIKYLKNYIFKINPSIYNYDELIKPLP